MDKEKFEVTNSEIGQTVCLNKEFPSTLCTILLDSMIGDTNLFFLDQENTNVCEIEIMIAEQWARGKHCGWDACLLMIWYGSTILNVKHFVAKILVSNLVSIKMFEKMGFVETSRSLVFNEVTLEKIVDDHWLQIVKNSILPYAIEDYKTDINLE